MEVLKADMEKKNPEVSDILLHMGEHDLPGNAVSPPIFQTSIFCFGSFDEFQQAIADEAHSYIYSPHLSMQRGRSSYPAASQLSPVRFFRSFRPETIALLSRIPIRGHGI